MPPSPALRERLQSIRENKKELTAAGAEIRRERESAQKAYDGANRDTPIHQWPEFTRLEAVTNRLSDNKAQMESLVEAEHEILRVVSGDGAMAPIGYNFLADPEKMEELEKAGNSSAPVGNIRLGQLLSASEMSAMLGGALTGGPGIRQKLGIEAAITDNAPHLREGPYRGIVPQLQRRLSLLDFFPSRPVDTGDHHTYTVESGSFAGAAETAEESQKPELSVTYTDATCNYRTIAGFVKLAKQKLADSAELGSRIRERGLYSVMQRLELSVLSGNASGSNLRGVLNTSGIADQPFVSGCNPADMVIRAASLIMAVGAQPNVAALPLADYIRSTFRRLRGAESICTVQRWLSWLRWESASCPLSR